MSIDKQQQQPSKPPPVIGKIGYYTVFITPPSEPAPVISNDNKKKSSPVQPPPVQYDKPGSKFGFLWDAVATLQNGTSIIFSQICLLIFLDVVFDILFIYLSI